MANNLKVLIVDDDVSICKLLELYLIKEGFLTTIVHNGADALLAVQKTQFDMILLDYMMPEMDGFETLQEIRKFSNIPVIMVTAKSEPMDKISSLDIGADDYVTKPFEPQELISRIKACLRRSKSSVSQAPETTDLMMGKLYISIEKYIVKIDGKKIDMPPKEIELLHHLASSPMSVFTREQLLKQVWGAAFKGDTRTVDVHVKRIREKLGESTAWRLETVWGVGYKFEIL
ncbi:MAG: response regulator transcription factor [Firmicutes bacterium]|nr:response regulator transcription factor [Bacillota bacterium]